MDARTLHSRFALAKHQMYYVPRIRIADVLHHGMEGALEDDDTRVRRFSGEPCQIGLC